MTKAEIGGAAIFLAASLSFGFYSIDPSTIKWAVIVFAAVPLIGWGLMRLWVDRLTVSVIDVWLAACLVYATASLVWSGDWRNGLGSLFYMIAAYIIFLFIEKVPRHCLRCIPDVMAFALIISMGVYFWKSAHWGSFGNPNFLAEFIIVAIPLAFGGLRNAVIAAAVVFLFIWVDTSAKWAAVLGMYLVIPFWLAKWGGYWQAVIFLAPALGFPFLLEHLGYDILSPVMARLEFAYNTLTMWTAAPFFGHGIGSFDYQYSTYQLGHLSVFPDQGTRLKPITLFAGAAHNEPLQLLAEYGAFGVGLVALTFMSIIQSARDNLDRAAFWSLYALAIISLFSFPLHKPQTILLFVIALGIRANGREALLLGGRGIVTGIGCALMILGIAGGIRSYQGSIHFSKAQVSAERKFPIGIFGENLKAVQVWPFDSHYRHQLMLSLRSLIRFYDNVQLSNVAADRAYKIAKSAGPNRPAVLAARVEYLLNAGRGNERFQEIEKTLEKLKRQAFIYPSVWLLDATWAAGTQRWDRAKWAVRIGLSLDPSKWQREQLEKILELKK